MRDFMKFIQTACIILLMAITANAQSDNKTQTISIGYIPTMSLDNTNFGLHLGYNKIFLSNKRFTPELQASYSLGTFDNSDGLFDNGEGNIHIVNLLGGGRVYILRREEKTNLYLNVLVGYAAIFDRTENNDGIISKEAEHDLGGSIGLTLETKKNISIGLAVETWGTGVLKVGYSF